jgi:allophanate hydrolase
MNLLDLAAVALPAGRYAGRLPWGVTVFADAGTDLALLEIAHKYERTRDGSSRAEEAAWWDCVSLAVCGAHLDGLALNWQLTSRGGALQERTRTGACYRMFVVPAGNGLPERPALIRDDEEGAAIEVELWGLTREAFGEFVAAIPGPLGVGKVCLADGREVPGFIAEPRAAAGAREITAMGGWRAYLADGTPE